jgi:hypothetical protein
MQKQCLERIFDALRQHGLEPCALPREDWTNRNPAEQILGRMSVCFGVIIIAFPRLQVIKGIEWPESGLLKPIYDRQLPTVWLQIEAAFALASRLPLLSLVDRDLHAEGLVNPRHDVLHAIYFNAASSQHQLEDSTIAKIGDFAARVESFAGRGVR